MPVKLEKTVKMSARYIAIGSEEFSPAVNAVVGEVGSKRTSKLLKTISVFSVKSRRTF